MPPRTFLVAVFVAALASIPFFMFIFDLQPTASIHSAQPRFAWNGYQPFVRFIHLPDAPAFLPRFFSWLFSAANPFSRSNHSATSAATNATTHTFLTATIAGIPVAYHNPFLPHRLAGVALLLHACTQSASDWFTLPEHRRLVAHLLRQRLVPLAVSSANRHTACWSTRFPSSKNLDALRVQNVLHEWRHLNLIPTRAPLYAIGLSSGATFLSVLSSSRSSPTPLAQVLYLSAGNPRAVRNASALYPKTLFVRLVADIQYAPAADVLAARSALLARNVPLVAELPIPRERWNPLSIHHHEPRISPHISDAVYSQLQHCSFDLECAFHQAAKFNASVAHIWEDPHLRRAAQQVARVLQGGHEMTAAYADQVVDWLARQGTPKQSGFFGFSRHTTHLFSDEDSKRSEI